MTTTQDIVTRLWNLCHVLRDDGITYHEYVTELTFLLQWSKSATEGGCSEKPRFNFGLVAQTTTS